MWYGVQCVGGMYNVCVTCECGVSMVCMVCAGCRQWRNQDFFEGGGGRP